MNCPRCGEELTEKMGQDFNIAMLTMIPHAFWHCEKCGFRSDVASL